MVDHNVFFRNATLRICGNLQIEDAMTAWVQYVDRYIPVDRMFLQILEPDLSAMRTLAIATRDSGEKVDLLTPISPSARDRLGTNARGLEEEGVVIDTDDNPVAREMLRYHGIPGWTVLRMGLEIEHGRLGALVLTAKKADCYTPEHAQLLGLLKDPVTIALANMLEHREVLRLRDRLQDDNRYLNRELQRITGDQIIGSDFGLRGVMRQVYQVAPTDSPVLLTGETGVGKDVIANAIHLASPRSRGPFIPVNCGAIPDSLLDSELFGHEKGAFTGALTTTRGRFERADGGTILLDEIGEMPLEAQVRLLRVLQHREIERVGGTRRRPVDIRIIAATNLNLRDRVRAGRFREDLWFRLNVFPIDVPPLRERRTDIPALVHHFVDQKARELKIAEPPRLALGAIDDLMAYDWPGNVRELENLVERAMILHRGEPLQFGDLLQSSEAKNGKHQPEAGPASLSLDQMTKRHIEQVLHKTAGKIHGPGGAGELLGVNPNTLRYKMRKLGIPFRNEQRPR